METPGNAGRLGRSAIDSNNMLYKTFKYSHGEEMYTEVLKFSLSTQKALLQIRIGSHKLPVNNRLAYIIECHVYSFNPCKINLVKFLESFP